MADDEREILARALEHARSGGTALVIALDRERLQPLLRRFVQLAGKEAAAWDDRTIRVGKGFCSFFAPETIEFVLERKHWYASRRGPAPEVFWLPGARERADEQKSIPDRSIDLSHLFFGERSLKDGERLCRTSAAGPMKDPSPVEQPNPFLTKVMQRLRRGRLRLTRKLVYYNGVRDYPDGTHVSTWFQTRGCTWDLRSGGCTMCNYAKGIDLSPDEMLASIRQAFSETGDLDVESYFVYSAGSTFDPVEVPPGVRRGIWATLSHTGARQAKTQARPEHVTRELVQEFVASVPGKLLAVHVGLESACAWVLRFCINRGGHPDAFARAVALLREHGVRVRANVILGSPFLGEREALEDAVLSMKWAFDCGADEVGLLPVHAKPNTLLAELYALGLYRPASLWSLVEILRGVDAEHWPRVRFHGWVSSYPDGRKLVASPSTCPRCRERVVALLSECHHTWSREPLEELTAQKCRCKDIWREELGRAPDRPLAERVFETYGILAREQGLGDWWDDNAAEIEKELHATRPVIERRSARREREQGLRPRQGRKAPRSRAGDGQ